MTRRCPPIRRSIAGFADPRLLRAPEGALYTNLPPGSYKFRVIASNPDGVWNTEEAVAQFHVDALLWQTWWFRAGIVFWLRR